MLQKHLSYRNGLTGNRREIRRLILQTLSLKSDEDIIHEVIIFFIVQVK